MSIEREYLSCCIANFQSTKSLGDKTITRLTDEQLNWSPASESNSIATIIRHMSGNMVSRWTDFLTADGEKPDRNRNTEFESANTTAADLLQMWEDGWRTLFDTLQSLTEANVEKTIYMNENKQGRLFKAALFCSVNNQVSSNSVKTVETGSLQSRSQQERTLLHLSIPYCSNPLWQV